MDTDTGSELHRLRQDLVHIKRQAKRQVMATWSTIVALIVLLLSGAKLPDDRPLVVGREFVVKDGQGKDRIKSLAEDLVYTIHEDADGKRIVLMLKPDGSGIISLTGVEKKVGISLGILGQMGNLQISGRKKEGISLGFLSDLSGLSMSDELGNVRIELGMKEDGPELAFLGRDGEVRCRLALNREDEPIIEMTNREGEVKRFQPD